MGLVVELLFIHHLQVHILLMALIKLDILAQQQHLDKELLFQYLRLVGVEEE